MPSYYFWLAARSLRRNPVLTALMIAAIGLGVAMTMTAYTVLYVMSRDPIPQKSARLFAVQLDNGGADTRKAGDDEPPTQLTYRDSLALMQAHLGKRQAAMHEVSLTVRPLNRDLQPFGIAARATFADFFTMFDVPMLFGRAWSAGDDANKTAVVVLSKRLNDRLFGGSDSVGQSVRLNDSDYQIIGVIDEWEPTPRFYDVIGGTDFSESDEAFVPFEQTIEKQIWPSAFVYCDAGPIGESLESFLRSECVWNQFWVELPTSSDVDNYRTFLGNYAREQQRNGRFGWGPNTRLRDVRDWLVARKVVPNDARLSVVVAFSFLIVCLLNTLGLMLAKLLGRSGQFGLRRALGASRNAIFIQCLIESGAVGLAGGALGLALTLSALWGMRHLFPGQMGRIAYMDTSMLTITIGLAVVATLVAGVYPAWRSMHVTAALQLKLN